MALVPNSLWRSTSNDWAAAARTEVLSSTSAVRTPAMIASWCSSSCNSVALSLQERSVESGVSLPSSQESVEQEDVQDLAEGEAGSDSDVGVGRGDTGAKHGDHLGDDPLSVLLAELSQGARCGLRSEARRLSAHATKADEEDETHLLLLDSRAGKQGDDHLDDRGQDLAQGPRGVLDEGLPDVDRGRADGADRILTNNVESREDLVSLLGTKSLQERFSGRVARRRLCTVLDLDLGLAADTRDLEQELSSEGDGGLLRWTNVEDVSAKPGRMSRRKTNSDSPSFVGHTVEQLWQQEVDRLGRVVTDDHLSGSHRGVSNCNARWHDCQQQSKRHRGWRLHSPYSDSSARPARIGGMMRPR